MIFQVREPLLTSSTKPHIINTGGFGRFNDSHCRGEGLNFTALIRVTHGDVVATFPIQLLSYGSISFEITKVAGPRVRINIVFDLSESRAMFQALSWVRPSFLPFAGSCQSTGRRWHALPIQGFKGFITLPAELIAGEHQFLPGDTRDILITGILFGKVLNLLR